MDDLTMVLFRNMADAGLAMATVFKCVCVKLVRFFVCMLTLRGFYSSLITRL